MQHAVCYLSISDDLTNSFGNFELGMTSHSAYFVSLVTMRMINETSRKRKSSYASNSPIGRYHPFIIRKKKKKKNSSISRNASQSAANIKPPLQAPPFGPAVFATTRSTSRRHSGIALLISVAKTSLKLANASFLPLRS